MSYTATMSLYFLMMSVLSMYTSAWIPRLIPRKVFARCRETRLIRPALWIFSAICMVGCMVGICTLAA